VQDERMNVDMLKQACVVTRNSPSRLDVGFITLKSDANIKSRQHEHNGAIKKRCASVGDRRTRPQLR